MNSKNQYKHNDYIYIVVPQCVYIKQLKISGPIVSPLKVRAIVAYEILCSGIRVIEYNPTLKRFAEMTVSNAFDKNKFKELAEEVKEAKSVVAEEKKEVKSVVKEVVTPVNTLSEVEPDFVKVTEDNKASLNIPFNDAEDSEVSEEIVTEPELTYLDSNADNEKEVTEEAEVEEVKKDNQSSNKKKKRH